MCDALRLVCGLVGSALGLARGLVGSSRSLVSSGGCLLLGLLGLDAGGGLCLSGDLLCEAIMSALMLSLEPIESSAEFLRCFWTCNTEVSEKDLDA